MRYKIWYVEGVLLLIMMAFGMHRSMDYIIFDDCSHSLYRALSGYNMSFAVLIIIVVLPIIALPLVLIKPMLDVLYPFNITALSPNIDRRRMAKFKKTFLALFLAFLCRLLWVAGCLNFILCLIWCVEWYLHLPSVKI